MRTRDMRIEIIGYRYIVGDYVAYICGRCWLVYQGRPVSLPELADMTPVWRGDTVRAACWLCRRRLADGEIVDRATVGRNRATNDTKNGDAAPESPMAEHASPTIFRLRQNQYTRTAAIDSGSPLFGRL